MLLEVCIQEVIQGTDWCEVADEPVVVSKVRPMKASNVVEDKTRPTVGSVFNRAGNTQKGSSVAKGGSVL
jgi:hypothetical protein